MKFDLFDSPSFLNFMNSFCGDHVCARMIFFHCDHANLLESRDSRVGGRCGCEYVGNQYFFCRSS